MKAGKLRELTSEELAQAYRENRKELLDVRAMRGLGGEGTQPLRIRTLRRDGARIRTIMRERELNDGGSKDA